jgi:hypothetical protein
MAVRCQLERLFCRQTSFAGDFFWHFTKHDPPEKVLTEWASASAQWIGQMASLSCEMTALYA